MGQAYYVFILSGPSPLVIHPFDDHSLFRDGPVASIFGRVGLGESSTDTGAVRAALHVEMEKGSRRYHIEKGYYARLALTVAAFVVTYLFFSLVIRDPIPLIDELLLGGLAAVAVHFAAERRALSSKSHVSSMLGLRSAIDGAFFTESRLVDLVDAWRDEAASLGPAAYFKRPQAIIDPSGGEAAEAQALCEMLRARFKAKPAVSEIYEASLKGSVPGALLDRAARKLGSEEFGLAIAYLKLVEVMSAERA